MSLPTVLSAAIQRLMRAYEMLVIGVGKVVLALVAEERHCRREEAFVSAALAMGVLGSLLRIKVATKAETGLSTLLELVGAVLGAVSSTAATVAIVAVSALTSLSISGTLLVPVATSLLRIISATLLWRISPAVVASSLLLIVPATLLWRISPATVASSSVILAVGHFLIFRVVRLSNLCEEDIS